jgi:hypothetical protein
MWDEPLCSRTSSHVHDTSALTVRRTALSKNFSISPESDIDCWNAFSYIINAAHMGIPRQAAVEHEFYLARATPNGYEPFDRSLYYSSVGFATSARIMDDIIAALEQQGIQVEQFMPELGPGQQELSNHYAEALDAADNALLVRETVRRWPSSMPSSPRLLPSHSWTRLAVARTSIAASGALPAHPMPDITCCLISRNAKEPRHAIRNTAPHTRATPASMGFFVGCATPDGMCARLRRSAGDRA